MKKYSSKIVDTIKVGYVIIPKDQEGEARDLFIADCIRKSKVSILLENGLGVAHNCPVSDQCIGKIVFPERFGQTGTCVLVHIDPMHSMPMVFATMKKVDEFNYFEEGQDRLYAGNANNSAEVSVSTNAVVNINVNSDEDNGEVNINVVNNNRTGKLNIKVIGEVNIYSSGKISVISDSEIEAKVQNIEEETESYFKIVKGEGISYMDEFGNSLETNSDGETIFNNNAKDSFIADLNQVVSQMNVIEDDINDLKTVFGTTWVVVPTDGGAALKAASAAWAGVSLTNTTKDDLKDERIKN